MKKIVIVGNAELKEDYSVLIDGADIVVRFNEAKNYDSGFAGTKTDILCIANIAHPGRRFAKYQTIKKLAFISQVKTVWFPHFFDHIAMQLWIKPISKRRFQKTSYCNLISLRNDLTYKNILYFSNLHNTNACTDLNITELSNLRPSSGYLAVKYILEHYSTDAFEIIILGFTFSGCIGHPWDEEKANILAWSVKGLIKII